MKTDFLCKNLDNLGCEVFEFDVIKDIQERDDKPNYLNTKNVVPVGQVNKKLSEAVQKSIEQNFVPITLGGDHSLAIGSIHGSSTAITKRKDNKLLGSSMGVIWVDAHADINTPLTSDSGNLHGQPLSFILHELDKYLPSLEGFEWTEPW